MERVSLATYDGVTLAAHLYLPAAPTSAEDWAPGIVLCHGFGSAKERHADFGEQASAAGFAVLILDLRGHGESEGKLDENVFNDVAAALSYLQSRPEVNPTRVAVRGSSFGGWLAIHTASHLSDLAPVVAVCPPTELLLTSLVEEVGMVQRGHTSAVLSVYGDRLPRVNVESLLSLLFRVDIEKAAKRINPRPLLLIHCEGDETVPSHISERIYNKALEPKALWLLPGGDHRFAQHDPGVNSRALEWLKDSIA